MTKPVNTTAFAKSTGRSWAQWLAFLDGIGARDLTHKEIARRIVETGEATGWWAQGIALAYEQHIRRRSPGQRSDGAFEVAVSRTVSGSLDDALALWTGAMAGLDAVDGVAMAGAPRVSATAAWRYWRSTLADGSRVSVTIGRRGGDKAAIAVAHEKLAGAQDKDRWRAYWKNLLGTLG